MQRKQKSATKCLLKVKKTDFTPKKAVIRRIPPMNATFTHLDKSFKFIASQKVKTPNLFNHLINNLI